MRRRVGRWGPRARRGGCGGRRGRAGEGVSLLWTEWEDGKSGGGEIGVGMVGIEVGLGFMVGNGLKWRIYCT